MPTQQQIHKLRDSIVEGIVDSVSLPEVSSHDSMAAHEVLGCPMFTSLCNVVVMSGDMPDPLRQATNGIVVAAAEELARRILTDGLDSVRNAYGHHHVTRPEAS